MSLWKASRTFSELRLWVKTSCQGTHPLAKLTVKTIATNNNFPLFLCASDCLCSPQPLLWGEPPAIVPFTSSSCSIRRPGCSDFCDQPVSGCFFKSLSTACPPLSPLSLPRWHENDLIALLQQLPKLQSNRIPGFSIDWVARE